MSELGACAMAATLSVAAALVLVLASPSEARPVGTLAAVAQFRQLNPCPSTGKVVGRCPGYVVDYVVPPCAEGENAVDNLQWLALAQAKGKGDWEREYCRFHRARQRMT